MIDEEMAEEWVKENMDKGCSVIIYEYVYPECSKYRGNCFSCSGPICIGLAKRVAEMIFWETYSYEDS